MPGGVSFPSDFTLCDGFSARHSPVTQLEVAEEVQQTVWRTVAAPFPIDGIYLCQDFLLQCQIGVEIDLSGLYRFMSEPQGYHGSIYTGL